MLCLKRPEAIDKQAWNAQVADLAANLTADTFACSFAVNDSDVADAHLLEMKFTQHPNDAVLSIWVEHAYDLENVYAKARELGELQAYAVSESAALPNRFKVGRVEGMCQIAWIKRPETQTVTDWLNAWLGNHTKVAIDTQSTFGYRQNVIATALPLNRPEPAKWPLMDAIVEENFPAIAMTSREAFFAAEGDAEKFERHQQVMMQSCANFIDFECFDCVPMSQYVLKEFG